MNHADAKPSTSDEEYLAQESHLASQALARTLASLKEDLVKGMNPLDAARKYPWLALGSALVAGVAATAVLVPSKEQQALRRLARIERALNRHNGENGGGKAEHKRSSWSAIAGFIVRQLLGALRPALVALMTPDPVSPGDAPSKQSNGAEPHAGPPSNSL